MIFLKLRQISINLNSKFLSTFVAYRFYTLVIWFPLGRKWLNHIPAEFAARKKEIISDHWARQYQKFIFLCTDTGKWLQKHDVFAATLILDYKIDVVNTLSKRNFFWSSDVKNLTFWQRYVFEILYVDIYNMSLRNAFAIGCCLVVL